MAAPVQPRTVVCSPDTLMEPDEAMITAQSLLGAVTERRGTRKLVVP